MSSYLLAIWSDGHGNPYTGPGRVGHVARVAAYAPMPVVDEFTDGGVYEHADCAPACIQSRLLQGGIHATIREIEQLAGTGPRGTYFPGIERCLRTFGVPERFETGNPPPGWIMNPAGGRLVSPVAFPSYLRASQGGCIEMTDPTPQPPPVPIPLKEPLMQTFVIQPLPAGEELLVPGLTGTTSMALAAAKGTVADLFIWDQSGRPLASKNVVLKGNGETPGVGPPEVSGYLYQVLGVPASTGPVLLSLSPGTEPYSCSVW